MNHHLTFSTSTELLRVPDHAVVFIAADGNYSSITMADGGEYVVTLQLGQIERLIAASAITVANRFIRIGKSLIVNRDYIIFINPQRQRLMLSDGQSFRRELTASKEALKKLKELLEEEQ